MKKRLDIALLFGGGAASLLFLVWGFIGTGRGTLGELSPGKGGSSGGNASMNLIIFGVAGLIGTLLYAAFHDWVQPDAEGRSLSGWEIFMVKLSRWFGGSP